MAATDPITAVVVRVRLPSGLDRVRRRHDLAAASGVPAHVTLLFPFLRITDLNARVRRELAGIARQVPPFEVRFVEVGRFPGVVYLRPEPSAPFARLTAAIVARFPDFLPYGGAHAEVVPHLTLTESAEAPLDAISAAAQRSLPFSQHVSAIELLAQDGSGRWGRRWRIALGQPPQAGSIARAGSRHMGRRAGTPGAATISARTRNPNRS